MNKKDKMLQIQEMLMREMNRLDDSSYMANNGASEVSRSNALTSSAMTYIKTINIQLRIKEIAEKTQVTEDSINKELGL